MIQVNLSENRLCGVWRNFGQLNGTYTAESINAIADALRVTGSLTQVRAFSPVHAQFSPQPA